MDQTIQPTQPIVPVAPVAVPPANPPAMQMTPPSFSAEFAPSPDVQAISQQATSTRDMAARLVNALTAPGAAMPPVPQMAAPQQTPPPPPPPPPANPMDMEARFADTPAQANAEAPIPTIPPEQNIAITQNTPENIGHAFAASRAEAKQFRQLAEQMKQQLEAERARAADWAQKEADFTKQLDEANQRADTYASQLGQLDLSRDPAFRAQYDTPLQTVQARIAQTLAEAGFDQQASADTARSLMLADVEERHLEQLNLPPEQLGIVAIALRTADGLWQARSDALADWQKTKQGVDEVSAREAAQSAAEHRAGIVEHAVSKAAAIAPTLQWSGDEYAPRRDAAVTRAKAWFQSAPDEQIAAAAIEGFMAPFAYERIDKLTAEVNELRARLAGRASLSAPPVAPLYPSQPLPTPAAPPPPPQNVPWTPVSQAGNTNAMALQLVQGLLARN